MVIFHSYVSLPEGKVYISVSEKMAISLKCLNELIPLNPSDLQPTQYYKEALFLCVYVLSRNQTLRSAGSRTVQLPCFVDTRLRNKKGDRGNMKSVRPECIGQRPGRPHLLMGHNMVWTCLDFKVQCPMFVRLSVEFCPN